MSVSKTEMLYTAAEYLNLERESEERHEYLDGQIYAMSGETTQHGDISVNLVGELQRQLRGTPCRVWTKDTKVLCGSALKSGRTRKGLFAYPDLVVVCGEPQFLDEHRDVVLNPKVIIEVLSPTTEGYDRGAKFWRYRTHLATMVDYVLVSQTLPLIEVFRRQPSGEWAMSTAAGLEGSLNLDSIECVLNLSDVYDRVVFPEEMPELLFSE